MLGMGVVWLFIYDMSITFDMSFDMSLMGYEFDGKNNDFDRVVLFMNLVWLKSIDFTSVLNDFWFVNKLVLMCYFFIKYDVFGWVRFKLYFSMVWGDFWC